MRSPLEAVAVFQEEEVDPEKREDGRRGSRLQLGRERRVHPAEPAGLGFNVRDHGRPALHCRGREGEKTQRGCWQVAVTSKHQRDNGKSTSRTEARLEARGGGAERGLRARLRDEASEHPRGRASGAAQNELSRPLPLLERTSVLASRDGASRTRRGISRTRCGRDDAQPPVRRDDPSCLVRPPARL